MSLYRKYRPKDFPSLIGQEHIKVTLLNAIKAGNISHAYLFTGPRGTGKTTTARLLAKAINAETMTEDGRFDGSVLAEEIDSGRLIDVIEIDAASNRGVDEIRDLREKINYAPTRAKNKVYIIDEVHMLTKEAFNALLKTLEEPPSFVYFILATTEINKVPETIISRCQRFDFRRITEQVLIDHLRQVSLTEEIVADEEALQIIAKYARGGARDALTLLEQIATGNKLEAERVKKVLGISNFTACDELLAMLEGGRIAEAMAKLDQIFQAGVDLVQFNRDILDFLRQKLLETVKAGNHQETGRYIELLGFFQEAYEKQKFSYIPELPLEVAIAKAGLRGVNLSATRPSVTDKADQDGSKKKTESITPVTPAPIPQSPADLKNLDDLIKRWSGVLERIHNPLAKRCLMAGKPVQLDSGKLTLAFSSNFNKDKLFVPDLLAISEQAIREEYGETIKLQGKVDPSIASEFTAEKPASPTAPKLAAAPEEVSAGQPAGQNNMMESALNVFGGEVVG